MPNIGIVVGLLISPFLVKLMGQKPTVLTGLLITLLAGVFPEFSSAYMPILVSRVLIGFGIGLFNSLAVSLIPQFYSSDEQELATMVGFQNSVPPLGTAVASFLISWLITISWHAAFAIYFLVIPVFIMFAIFVPLPKEEQAKKTDSGKAKPKQHINGQVVKISIFMFLIFMFYITVSFKQPALIVQQHLGTISELSILSGVMNLIAIPVGASFGFFFKKLHDKIFPLGFLFATLGFLTIAFSPNFIVLTLGNLLFGVGFGLAVPYMYNWLDWAAPDGSVNLATTIVLVLVNVGCSISPMVINAMSTDPKIDLIISGVFFACFTIYALCHYFNVHKNEAKDEK